MLNAYWDVYKLYSRYFSDYLDYFIHFLHFQLNWYLQQLSLSDCLLNAQLNRHLDYPFNRHFHLDRHLNYPSSYYFLHHFYRNVVENRDLDQSINIDHSLFNQL